MQSRNIRFQGKYDPSTIYLTPGVTIFLASFDSWTDTNLSVLSNRTGSKLLFAVQGFATGIYYYVCVRHLLHMGRYRNPGDRTLVYTAATFLLMAVTISYMPEEYPPKAGLHVLLTFFSPVLLAFSIIGFLRFFGSRDRTRFCRARGILQMMTACPVFFLLEIDFITSFLEIFTITGLCGYLRYMKQLLAA